MGKAAMPLWLWPSWPSLSLDAAAAARRAARPPPAGPRARRRALVAPSYSGGTGAKGVGVALRKVSFGMVVVGPDKRTVYLFEKDKGTKSTCTVRAPVSGSPLTTSGSAERRRRPDRVAPRHEQAQRRRDPGHLRRPSALLLRRRQAPRADRGPKGKKEFGADWYAVGASGKKVEKAGS